MSFFNNPNRIPESYGLRIAAGLIVFFLIMNAIGLGHHVELRLLNLVILTAGVWAALKKFQQTHSEHLNYFRGLIMGVATAGFGSLVFGVFLVFYLKIDTGMMEALVQNEAMGRYLNPYITSFIIV